jgi:hypothetical protein
MQKSKTRTNRLRTAKVALLRVGKRLLALVESDDADDGSVRLCGRRVFACEVCVGSGVIRYSFAAFATRYHAQIDRVRRRELRLMIVVVADEHDAERRNVGHNDRRHGNGLCIDRHRRRR